MRNPQKSDDEWFAIITKARRSGLSDRAWCEKHHISKYSFYNAVGRLRKKSYLIPEAQQNEVVDFTASKQEIVRIDVENSPRASPLAVPAECITEKPVAAGDAPAVSISLSGCTINIDASAPPALVNALMSSLRGML